MPVLQKSLVARAIVWSVAAVLSAAACSDSTGPDDTPRAVSAVAVSGVRLDPIAFRSSGAFTLGVVPTAADGRVLLDDRAQIRASVAGLPAANVSFVSRTTQGGGSKPLAAALDIDNSGSMGGSDPSFLRRSASSAFWTAVFATNPAHEVALADFGHGASAGFTSTRLLQSWGRDANLLTQRLDSMTASGGTPLYESTLEMLRWIDSTRARSAFDRVLVLMTDGQPNNDRYRDSVAALAAARGIVIHTVGLGNASDIDSTRAASAAVIRVRELAYRTGGVYAAATSAVALDPIFRTIATASSAGQVLATFQISPIPPPGTVVRGTVTVTAGGVTREANWSLVAP